MKTASPSSELFLTLDFIYAHFFENELTPKIIQSLTYVTSEAGILMSFKLALLIYTVEGESDLILSKVQHPN